MHREEVFLYVLTTKLHVFCRIFNLMGKSPRGCQRIGRNEWRILWDISLIWWVYPRGWHAHGNELHKLALITTLENLHEDLWYLCHISMHFYSSESVKPYLSVSINIMLNWKLLCSNNFHCLYSVWTLQFWTWKYVKRTTLQNINSPTSSDQM